MSDNDYTVILDKREGANIKGAEVGDAVLRGKPIYKTDSTGLADSIQAMLDEDLIHVPTYSLIAGRAFVGKEDEAWSKSHDTNAERLTVLDEKGIWGTKGIVYALDIQNGGLFIWNPQRIYDALEGDNLVNSALQLEQDEVNNVLDAMERNDTAALKQIVHGGNVAFAGDYDGFVEASDAPDFLQSMKTTYLVIRPASEAGKLKSDYQSIATQRENPDIIIASGGKVPARKILDQAESFEWQLFGTWHDDYKNANTGRVVCLSYSGNGVYGNKSMNLNGRPVGVAPEALNAFYKQDTLAMKVNQAMRTAKPVQHGDGVILYIPNIQLKQ